MSIEKLNGKQIEPGKLDEIVQRAAGWAILNGAQKKITASEFPERVEPMPITLFPSVLPASVLHLTKSLHTTFQTVMHKVANDHEFMKECFQSILSVDDFTREFWNIYETVRNEGISQKISVMLTRNDFMMEETDNGDLACKQVEFNTFSSGAGGVIGAMRDIHRYTLSLLEFPFREDQLPHNQPTAGLAKGLAKAWSLYENSRAVIMFVVGIPEPNTPDQRWLERDIFRINPSIRVIYRTFSQLLEQVSLGSEKQLIIDGMEVAVVYYRYGYSPGHYPTEKEFNLRLEMERSRAIKCPPISYHLAGCKKIQQVLAEPGVLERFLPEAGPLRTTFVGLYKLDTADSQSIIAQALQNPEKFVLKPQREGGGNNKFGEELKDFLEKIMNTPEISAWILMDRIKAVRHQNRLIRVGLGPEVRDVVSELGIFGVHISCGSEEVENFECGYLLRTKPETANEAGLFSGHSCLDSPFLI